MLEPATADYDYTLTAAPAQYPLFNGWSNGICNGSGGYQFVLNANASMTATFNKDIAHQVKISGVYYPSIQCI